MLELYTFSFSFSFLEKFSSARPGRQRGPRLGLVHEEAESGGNRGGGSGPATLSSPGHPGARAEGLGGHDKDTGEHAASALALPSAFFSFVLFFHC